MQIVSSYGVEMKKKNIPLRATLDIFRQAVSYQVFANQGAGGQYRVPRTYQKDR